MDKSEEYTDYAAEALSVAERSESPDEKLALLEIAQRWLDLAGTVWTPHRVRNRALWRDKPFSERN
jgi:hypothetical protein